MSTTDPRIDAVAKVLMQEATFGSSYRQQARAVLAAFPEPETLGWAAAYQSAYGLAIPNSVVFERRSDAETFNYGKKTRIVRVVAS